MTKIAIQPNASGSGVFTIAAPDSNTNRTFTLPDAGGEVLTDQSSPPLTQGQAEDPASTVFGTVSGQRLEQQTNAAFNVSGSAPKFACRAWVNFNGTGTVAIRASGNVSSITDNGTGDYTVNFATAMPDANYSVLPVSGRGTGDTLGNVINVTNLPSITSFRLLIRLGRSAADVVDQQAIYVAVFR